MSSAVLTLPGYLETARLRAGSTGAGRVADVVRRRQVVAELALRERFDDAERRAAARIPTPATSRRLWQQHKYAVLAHDERGYRVTGPAVARGELAFEALAARLEGWLARAPATGGLRNAVEHMWGHVSERAEVSRSELGDDPWRLLGEVGREAVRQDNAYLLEQTALSELFGWQDG